MQRGRQEHGAQHAERRERVPDERLLAAREQPDRREHHRAEDHERDHVQQRLGHQRAEHRGQAIAWPAEPAGHDQRARWLAEPGRQGRRHQDADRGALHRVREARPGVRHRGLEDRVPGDRAPDHRQAHDGEADEHPDGLGVDERVGDRPHADAVERQQRAADGAERGRAEHGATGDPQRAVAAGRQRLERGQAPGRAAPPAVRGQRADLHGGARGHGGGRRNLAGVLVGVDDLLGDARPGVALGAQARGRAELGRARAVEREVAQRLGEPRRVPAREEQPVDAVGHHVAVAGDVRRHDRAAGGERLGQDHAERLAAQRRRGQHVGAARSRPGGPRRRPARAR